MFHCLVIKVVSLSALCDSLFTLPHLIDCVKYSFEVFYFSKFKTSNGEGGIRTLAPLLTTYSLSRGAPSASLGTSPNCPTQSLLFFRSVLYYIALFFICQELFSTFFKAERRRRDLNPRAAINDLLPFQGSPFSQLGYFSIVCLIHNQIFN